MLRLATRIVDGLGVLLFALVTAAIFISMIAGTADVLSIRFLVRTVPGAVEFSQNLMPVIVFGALAYIQREGQHVRVEFIYDKLGPRGRAILDVLNSVAVTFAAVALAWVSWQGFERSNAIKEAGMAFPFPIYPVKFFIVVGLAVMFLKMFVDIFVNIGKVRNPTLERSSLDRLLEESAQIAGVAPDPGPRGDGTP